MIDDNPYRPPEIAAAAVVEPLPEDAESLLRNWREQMNALGGFWLFLAVASGGAGFFLPNFLGVDELGFTRGAVILLCGTFCLLWLVLGVATCMKKMWAVHAGLVVSYLGIVVSLITLNACGVAVLVLVAVQAHRVIGWSRKLHAQGLLSGKPRSETDSVSR